jgi:hypothetical protein
MSSDDESSHLSWSSHEVIIKDEPECDSPQQPELIDLEESDKGHGEGQGQEMDEFEDPPIPVPMVQVPPHLRKYFSQVMDSLKRNDLNQIHVFTPTLHNHHDQQSKRMVKFF